MRGKALNWARKHITVLLLGIAASTSVSARADDEGQTEGVNKIFFDHLGYDRLGGKLAVIEISGASQSGGFELLRRDGSVAFAGELGAPRGVADWNNKQYAQAEFSSFSETGEFRLRTRLSDGSIQESSAFRIDSAHHFKATFALAMDYFLKSRATSEPAYSWDRSLRIIGNGGMTPVNLQGGWYDAAGDISKYLSHLSFANYMNPQQIPLTVWALAHVYERNHLLPEVMGNQAERLIAEARFGADFLVKMLSPEGYFYISVFDQWRGDQGSRFISVPTNGSVGTQSGAVQAAYREGGGMAIAGLARVARLSTASAQQASTYLQAAERAFAHLEANNRRYCDDGKENIIDDYTALLAATELYLATNGQTYLAKARQRAENLRLRLSTAGYFFSDSEDVPASNRSRPFWHGADAGLPAIALARYSEAEPDSSLVEATRATLKAHLDYQLQVNAETANPFQYPRQTFRYQGRIISGFFMPHENETTYWWQGENARLGSIATAAIYAGQKAWATRHARELKAPLVSLASDQLAWILGRNPFDVSFMDGVGRNNPPAYSARKPGHTHLAGGIANGITGQFGGKYSDESGREFYRGDGKGLSWNPREANPPMAAAWENWRWVEQWLPHTTWYLLAISSLAELESSSFN